MDNLTGEVKLVTACGCSRMLYTQLYEDCGSTVTKDIHVAVMNSKPSICGFDVLCRVFRWNGEVEDGRRIYREVLT